MGASSPRYTAEFKQEAVELYGKSGTTYAEAARGPGCDAGDLSDWAKKADAAMESLMDIVESECVHARGGRAGHLRVHRGGVQPGEDPLGAGLHEPGRV